MLLPQKLYVFWAAGPFTPRKERVVTHHELWYRYVPESGNWHDGTSTRKIEAFSAATCVPLFLTDGFKEYRTAILTHFGHWMQRERRQDKGRLPKPRWMPLPELLYAQVMKSYRRRRLVGVKHCVVFGTQLAIERVLARCGWTINTAFVERLNLDIRQCVASVGRRANTLCQGEEGLLDRLVLFQTYHNFVLPMRACASHCWFPRRPMARARRRCGGRIHRRWRPA